MQLDRVMVPMMSAFGMPYSPESLEEKRHNLSVVATSHNTAEILSVFTMLVVVGCEAMLSVWGFSSGSSDTGVSTSMPAKFRETGVTGAWRGEVPKAEVAIALLMVLFLRTICTLFEDKLGAKRFGARGGTVNKMIDLILRDGPQNKRAMCFMIVLAQLIIMPTEMAYVGMDLHAAAAEADD